MKGKVIQGNATHAKAIEELRLISYQHSSNFNIVDEESFASYIQWNLKDEEGTTLAIEEEGKLLATMRGNVYKSDEELITADAVFKNVPLEYPVLNMTIAATHPHAFKSGFNSVLRYYMYCLHQNNVEMILGKGAYFSSIYKTLFSLGYEFVAKPLSLTSLQSEQQTFFAVLRKEKFTAAIEKVHEKNKEAISQYPLDTATIIKTRFGTKAML